MITKEQAAKRLLAAEADFEAFVGREPMKASAAAQEWFAMIKILGKEMAARVLQRSKTPPTMARRSK